MACRLRRGGLVFCRRHPVADVITRPGFLRTGRGDRAADSLRHHCGSACRGLREVAVGIALVVAAGYRRPPSRRVGGRPGPRFSHWDRCPGRPLPRLAAAASVLSRCRQPRHGRGGWMPTVNSAGVRTRWIGAPGPRARVSRFCLPDCCRARGLPCRACALRRGGEGLSSRIRSYARVPAPRPCRRPSTPAGCAGSRGISLVGDLPARRCPMTACRVNVGVGSMAPTRVTQDFYLGAPVPLWPA